MRLSPYGADPEQITAGGFAPKGMTLRQALPTLGFWLLVIAYGVSAFSHTGAMQNQVPYLQDAGFITAVAASSITARGAGSATGYFFFGWLTDRIHPKYSFVIGMVLQAASIVILMNISGNSSIWVIWLCAFTLGMGIGSWLPTLSVTTAEQFGLAHYGSIFGIISFFESAGTALGPLFTAFIFVQTGSYKMAFIVLLVLYAIAIPAILFLRKPRQISA